MKNESILYNLEQLDDAITESDLQHLENYKNLITFLENSLNNSVMSENQYGNLHSNCVKCIRYLDSLIHTYKITEANIVGYNFALEKIKEKISNQVEEVPNTVKKTNQ